MITIRTKQEHNQISKSLMTSQQQKYSNSSHSKLPNKIVVTFIQQNKTQLPRECLSTESSREQGNIPVIKIIYMTIKGLNNKGQANDGCTGTTRGN